MTAHIQEFIQEQGIEIDVGYDEKGALEHRISIEETEDEQDPAGPTVRRHNPMAMDTATIDSYQGQEKDLVILFHASLRYRHLVGQNLMPTPIDCASGLPGCNKL